MRASRIFKHSNTTAQSPPVADLLYLNPVAEEVFAVESRQQWLYGRWVSAPLSMVLMIEDARDMDAEIGPSARSCTCTAQKT